MSITVKVTFGNMEPPALVHPLDIMRRETALHPWKKIARLCCAEAHMVLCETEPNAAVTCCHAGHPSFMIRGDKVVGTAA